MNKNSQGFTLIEILVALSILAVAMTAVSRSASSGVQNAAALREHVIANWVAQNRMALHQAGSDWLPTGITTGNESQAGQDWPWQEEVIATPNPTMARIVVRVFAPGQSPEKGKDGRVLRELTGFLVKYPR
jgi:general secretion pathway protein I